MKLVAAPTGRAAVMDWASVAAFAKANPNHWVKLDEPVGQWATSAITAGRIEAFANPSNGHWESDMRDTYPAGNTYRGTLFVRWVTYSPITG